MEENSYSQEVEYLPLEPTKDKYLVNKTVGVDYGP